MQKRKQLERKQEKRRPPRDSECFGNEWIPLRPIVAVASEWPDAVTLPPSHQPIAVVLNLVNPRRTLGAFERGLGRQGRMKPRGRGLGTPALRMGALIRQGKTAGQGRLWRLEQCPMV